MFLGKVIGSVWATKKHPALEGTKLLLVAPIDANGASAGEPFAAADTAGAGAGETVIYITASEAVIPLAADEAPVDAAIVGVVDHTHAPEDPTR
ncbi:MAG: ethanolamine utilization protein EutN [Ignavibacteriales bacterium]|jgi:ethanolamine utilization protein EutN|nr:ethanolamine utilization protein EutN [Ignavibacteriales bacterium]